MPGATAEAPSPPQYAHCARAVGRSVARRPKPRRGGYVILEPHQPAFTTPIHPFLELGGRRLVIAGIATNL
jgi:hypothetical protein